MWLPAMQVWYCNIAAPPSRMYSRPGSSWRQVVEFTGNQTLVLLTAMLEHISRAAALSYERIHPDDGGLGKTAHRTRQKLVQLIKAGDADAAETLWRKHLTEAGRILTEGAGGNVVDLFT
jgi:GntR family transcriptional repressor for pyruvate dehydrogenase complex